MIGKLVCLNSYSVDGQGSVEAFVEHRTERSGNVSKDIYTHAKVEVRFGALREQIHRLAHQGTTLS